jgi:parvulin-like peptidyl-prolyl isomerase
LKDSGAKKEAANLIADIKAGKTTLEGQAGVKKTGLFTRDNPGTDPGLDKGVVKEAFALSMEKSLSETPVKGKLGYYVIKLIEKKRPEMNVAIQDADKNRIRRELLERKQAQAFDKWLSELKAKSKIERNESVLN